MGMYEYRTLSPTILTEHEVRRPRAVACRNWLKHPSLRAALIDVDWHRWRGYQRGVWQRFTLSSAPICESARARLSAWLCCRPCAGCESTRGQMGSTRARL